MRGRGFVRTIWLAVALALIAQGPLAAVATPTPAPVSGVVTQRVNALSLDDVVSRGPDVVTALTSIASTPAQSIEGTLTHSAGLWEDSYIGAFALQQFMGMWMPVAASLVSSTGAYAIYVEDPGTYKVAFVDYANVYATVYYKDAATDVTAQDVVVGAGQKVLLDAQALTALPEYLISGKVSYQGAPAPPEGVEITAYSYSTTWTEWEDDSYAVTKADNTYRIHASAAGAYRVGFWDYSGVFNEVYYRDASTVESATTVSVPDTMTPATGIDQTMTVRPSRRVSGADRYLTAVAACKDAFPNGASTVVIASGQNWPDALCAAPLAAASGAPLLLTTPGAVPKDVMEEIRRLRPYEVVVVGGYSAVGLAVDVALAKEPSIGTVRRIIGRDRFETGRLVAEAVRDRSWMSTESAIVCNGLEYADAMAAGPLAGWTGVPVLLTRPGELPGPSSSYLASYDVTRTYILGGTAAVSGAVASRLPNKTRLYGSDRYGTASSVASYCVHVLGMDQTMAGLASGQSFPDGLTAGAALGRRGAPLLLTRGDMLSLPAERHLKAHKGSLTRLTIYGGEEAISAEVEADAKLAAGL